ncbi:hypothetical protein ACA910_003418 [Epithemia clementina (nom. ined.)]
MTANTTTANTTTDAATTVSTTTESGSPGGGGEGGEVEERLGMLELIKQYLDSGNRSYQCQDPRDDGSQVISLNLTGNHSSYRTFIDVKAHQDRMLVFIESPVRAPDRSRAACAELLMRINYSLALGNFEIDFRDGEIRYRMAVDVEGSYLSLSMIETNIMVSAATMDRYFPAMMTVIYGNKAPVEALEEVRNPTMASALSSGTSSSQ